MRCTVRWTMLAQTMLAVVSTLAVFAQTDRAEEREIRKAEREWLNSYVTRDAAVMDRIEAEEFRIVYPNGTVVSKAQELDSVKKAGSLQGDVKVDTEDETVHIYGAAALVTGNFIQKGRYSAGPKKGQEFRIVERYTDVYVKRDGRWQVVASQLTAVPARQSGGPAQ